MTTQLLGERTPISGVTVVRRRSLEDDRGFLQRMYSAEDLSEWLGTHTVRQVNRTLTRRRGTVRGLHYQLPPYAEMKLVTCIRGRVFDVAVDVRQGSPTFLRWHAEVLSGTGDSSLLIPEGVAHGLQALSDDCELLYLHTAEHQPPWERGLNPRDPLVAIEWPEPITTLSARDRGHEMLTADFRGVEL